MLAITRLAVLAAVCNLFCLQSAAACVVLNECGVLPERKYSLTTTRTNPEVIKYRSQNVTFSNGVRFGGRRIAFDGDTSNQTPYLGVWIIPKGATIFVRLANQHPTSKINLHWHGLHVKGTGADDPSLEVAPGQSTLYTISVGRDHGEVDLQCNNGLY
jgi:FtsP/CotA-like multicopper oxidase with cupredoxin domain